MLQTQATVIDIEHSPNKEVAFVYCKPEQSFTFQEGQFMFLERMNFQYPDGKKMKNAYSIGTTNALLQEKGIVGTIVKKSSEGGMSEYLTQKIHIGDAVNMTAPLGHFIDPKRSRDYVFISIGSGITPVFALYNDLLQTQEFDNIINVFGERYTSNLLPSVLDAYTTHDDRITQLLYLSQEKQLPTGRESGYVQQSLDIIFSTLKNKKFQVFLCGKPVMVDDVVAILNDRGVENEYIHFEKY